MKLSTVRVLDSLNSTFLPLDVQKIIASIIHPTSSEVTVKFDDVALRGDKIAMASLQLHLQHHFAMKMTQECLYLMFERLDHTYIKASEIRR